MNLTSFCDLFEWTCVWLWVHLENFYSGIWQPWWPCTWDPAGWNRVRAVSSWCHPSDIAWDRQSCCKCHMKLAGIIPSLSSILGMRSCLRWKCVSCVPGDTCAQFFKATFTIPWAVLLVHVRLLLLLMLSYLKYVLQWFNQNFHHFKIFGLLCSDRPTEALR